MTTTVTTTPTTTTPTTPTGRRYPLVRGAALGGLLAAAATEALTAVVRAAGLDLRIGSVGGTAKDVVPIGFGACTIMIAICLVAGLGLAALLNRYAKRPARTFYVTTVALVVVSFFPDVLAGATAASSKLVLMACHVIAAAIIVPAIAAGLRTRR